jgi:hypothetical protein
MGVQYIGTGDRKAWIFYPDDIERLKNRTGGDDLKTNLKMVFEGHKNNV